METKDFLILILLGLGLWLFFKPEAMPHITVQEPAYSQPAVVYATPAPPTIPLVEATATAPHYVEAVQPRIDLEATTDAFMLTLETAASEPTVMPPTAVPAVQNFIGGAVEPTRDYNLTDDQLAACLQAQQTGRRLAPYCPPNPAEYAGTGR